MPGEQPGKVKSVVGLEAVSPNEPGPSQEARGKRFSRDQRGDIGESRSGEAGTERISRSVHAHSRAAAAIAAVPAAGATVNPVGVRRLEQRLTVISPKRVESADLAQKQYVLPQAVSKKPSYGAYIGFALCVLLPALCASIYYGFYAANQYVAEFRFTVKDASTTSTPSPMGGLTALMGASMPNSADNYLVADFLTSREAAEDLQKKINVVGLYSKPGVDWWSRFDASQPMEKFLPYWQSMVTAQYDQVTGIANATVRAFTPQDALLIANSLVALSEDLVNRIANRSAIDAVRFARDEVTKAEERLKAIRLKLTEYRNRRGVIDPTTSVVASNSTLVQTLRANLAQLETQLATLQRQNLAPNAPVVVSLKNQIKSTRDQIQSTEAMVGHAGDGAPLSSVMAEYEQLDLERQFAQNAVTSTMQALDQARANAAAQHLYITPYVRPSLPQSSTYPRRVFSVIFVGIFGFIFWVVGLLVVRSISERFA